MPRGSKAVDEKFLLNAALEGLELQRRRIEEQIREVRARLGRRIGRPPAEAKPALPKKAKKRRLSAAARKRIAVAQKKRWAEYRKKTSGEGA